MKIKFALILCSSALLAGCALQSAQPPQDASQNGQETIQPVNTDATLLSKTDVSIADFAFDPSTVTVKAGTTVVWTNNDSAPHKIAADGDLDGFGSNNISQGGRYAFTFTDAGTYGYHCVTHPAMKGSIVVEP